MIFCKHKWVEVERFYNEPVKSFKGETDEDLMNKLLRGCTTILYLCEKCGSHKTIEIHGKSEKS